AARKLERADPRPPIERATARNVLVGVPEGAIVGRIDSQRAVVAPSRKIRTGLRARPIDNDSLTLIHHAGRTRSRSPSVMNFRMNRASGNAETECHVAALVHGNATHPAIVRIGSVGTLLENCRRGVWSPDFV